MNGEDAMDYDNYMGQKRKKKKSRTTKVLLVFTGIAAFFLVATIAFYVTLKSSKNDSQDSTESIDSKSPAITKLQELKTFQYCTYSGTITYENLGKEISFGEYMDRFLTEWGNPHVYIWGVYSPTWMSVCVSGASDEDISIYTEKMIIDETGIYVSSYGMRGTDITGYTLSAKDRRAWDIMPDYIRLGDGESGKEVIDDLTEIINNSIAKKGSNETEIEEGVSELSFPNGFDGADNLISPLLETYRTPCVLTLKSSGEYPSRTVEMEGQGSTSFAITFTETITYQQIPDVSDYITIEDYKEFLKKRKPSEKKGIDTDQYYNDAVDGAD